MKVICEYPVGTLRNATSTDNIGSLARTLKVVPGVGQPFMVFASLPGLVSMVTGWPDGMVVSADETENANMINDQLANPPTSFLVF